MGVRFGESVFSLSFHKKTSHVIESIQFCSDDSIHIDLLIIISPLHFKESSNMSALRSKLYSSAFDDAMSKPLISAQERTDSQNNTTKNNHNHYNNNKNNNNNKSSHIFIEQEQDIESNQSMAMYSNQVLEKSKLYNPPALQTDYQLHDESDSSMIDLLILRERHEETQQIHSNMSTIREINTTLAQLVQSQQHDIDLIEENAIDVHENTAEALTLLEKANKLLKDGLGMEEGIMRMFFLVIAVGGGAIGIVMLLEALL
jgi:hypothetical protein